MRRATTSAMVVVLLAALPSGASATNVQDLTGADLGAFAQILAGSGVQVQTVQLSGASGPELDAVGHFNTAPSELGFKDGIALTSGSLQALLTMDDVGFQADSDVNLPDRPLDADYLAAHGNVPAQSTDLIRLTLEVIPAGHELRFGSYVFASEELDNPILPFADDGALILVDSSAAGPPDKNCALLPGGGAVTIANVGQSFTADPPGDVSAFDGFTDPTMECVAPVVPGEPATIRLVVFDRGDEKSDSGLLLATDSLTSDAVPNAALARTPGSGVAPLDVTFDTAGTADPGGQLASWELAFGDGQSQTGAGAPPAQIPHRYDTAGEYTATLTVTDSANQDASATQTVSVTAPAAVAPFTPPGPVPAAGSAAGADTVAPGGGPEPLGAPTIRVASRATLATALAGLRVTAGCSAACVIDAALLLDARTARRAKIRGRTVSGAGTSARRVVIGRARATLPAAGTRVLRLKLPSSAARKLRRARIKRVKLPVRITTAGGVVERTVTLTLGRSR